MPNWTYRYWESVSLHANCRVLEQPVAREMAARFDCARNTASVIAVALIVLPCIFLKRLFPLEIATAPRRVFAVQMNAF
jgi:hypothetical protein